MYGTNHEKLKKESFSSYQVYKVKQTEIQKK